MKNIDNKIIEYFEGNLNESQKKELLNLIEANPELKKNFEKYKNLYQLFNENKKASISQEYLDGILLKFRSSEKKRIFSLKPVFAASLMVVFISFSVIIYNNLFVKQDVDNIEISDIQDLNEFSFDNFTDVENLIEMEHIDELLIAELLGNDENLNLLKNYLQLDNDYTKISEPFAEEIYSELINKKIL